MNYAWDPRKNRRNFARHGIAFEDAVRIFDGPNAGEGGGPDYGEIRVYAIGIVNDLEITAIYTEVSETERRIISAWRAEQHEPEAYWQSIG